MGPSPLPRLLSCSLRAPRSPLRGSAPPRSLRRPPRATSSRHLLGHGSCGWRSSAPSGPCGEETTGEGGIDSIWRGRRKR
nr:unnamed protein product [Digitaria exilis]